MIPANSRYASYPLVPATNLDGVDILAITFAEPVNLTFQFQHHVVTGADTIDGLAYKIFGDATLWWVIARYNPELLDLSTIPVGFVLRVPVTNVAL